ncbi:hypothetical protein LshimejAT787_0400350 [Lyophyllum shimeji]|uniref:Uncharacterized protein n=1 Tax=Lyophyllum shimeji TaxID=47721 RepID=A0A9P3UJH8_LYOSH|nr:hypothetical protein LshimejAT787_0400350 [Lyophyllum shimeji]
MSAQLFLDPHSTLQRSDTYYAPLDEELEAWFYLDEVQSIRAGNTEHVFDANVQKLTRTAPSDDRIARPMDHGEQTSSYNAYLNLYCEVSSKLYPEKRPKQLGSAGPFHGPWLPPAKPGADTSYPAPTCKSSLAPPAINFQHYRLFSADSNDRGAHEASIKPALAASSRPSCLGRPGVEDTRYLSRPSSTAQPPMNLQRRVSFSDGPQQCSPRCEACAVSINTSRPSKARSELEDTCHLSSKSSTTQTHDFQRHISVPGGSQDYSLREAPMASIHSPWSTNARVEVEDTRHLSRRPSSTQPAINLQRQASFSGSLHDWGSLPRHLGLGPYPLAGERHALPVSEATSAQSAINLHDHATFPGGLQDRGPREASRKFGSAASVHNPYPAPGRPELQDTRHIPQRPSSTRPPSIFETVHPLQTVYRTAEHAQPP